MKKNKFVSTLLLSAACFCVSSMNSPLEAGKGHNKEHKGVSAAAAAVRRAEAAAEADRRIAAKERLEAEAAERRERNQAERTEQLAGPANQRAEELGRKLEMENRQNTRIATAQQNLEAARLEEQRLENAILGANIIDQEGLEEDLKQIQGEVREREAHLDNLLKSYGMVTTAERRYQEAVAAKKESRFNEMVAAVETREAAEREAAERAAARREEAATKIQAAYRGIKGRETAAEDRAAAEPKIKDNSLAAKRARALKADM